MKNLNLKRLLFILLIFIISNTLAFAKSGFEFILNVPIGGNYAYLSEDMKVSVDYRVYGNERIFWI